MTRPPSTDPTITQSLVPQASLTIGRGRAPGGASFAEFSAGFAPDAQQRAPRDAERTASDGSAADSGLEHGQRPDADTATDLAVETLAQASVLSIHASTPLTIDTLNRQLLFGGAELAEPSTTPDTAPRAADTPRDAVTSAEADAGRHRADRPASGIAQEDARPRTSDAQDLRPADAQHPRTTAQSVDARVDTDATPRPASDAPARPQAASAAVAPPQAPASSDGRIAITGGERVAKITAPKQVSPPSSSDAHTGSQRESNPAKALKAADKGGAGERATPVRTINAVARAISAAIAAKEGRITMRLTPTNLGSVRVQLHQHQGALRAEIETNTEEARRLLGESRESLRHALEARGVTVERISVTLTPSDAEGDGPREVRAEGDTAEADRGSGGDGGDGGADRHGAEQSRDSGAGTRADHGPESGGDDADGSGPTVTIGLDALA